MPKQIDFLSKMAPKMVSKMVPLGTKWLPKWSPKWFLWALGERFASKCRSRAHFSWFVIIIGASELYVSQLLNHLWYDFRTCFSYFFIFEDMCFRIIPSTNAESETKGGGGVSPPGTSINTIFVYRNHIVYIQIVLSYIKLVNAYTKIYYIHLS